MNTLPVRTEADYRTALKEISRLIDSDPDIGTPEGDRLDALTTLVQSYEARQFPIDPPDAAQIHPI